jgi:hypothetical protein
VAAVFLVLASAPRLAAADDVPPATRAAARTLGDEAVERFDAGDYAGALDRFQRADDLVHLTTTGLWVARCLVRLGRLVDAENRYVEVTRVRLPAGVADVLARAQVDAAQEREALEKRIPRVVVVLEGARAADAVAEIDGRRVPRALEGVAQPLDPGEHEVALVGPSGRRSQRLALAEGATERVVLRADDVAPPAPAPAPSDAPPAREPARSDVDRPSGAGWTRPAGFAALGLGGALVVTGGVTGALAVAKHADLSPQCPDRACPPALHGDVDALDRLRLVSTIGLAGGAALMGAGAILLLVRSDGAAPPSTSAWIGPGVAGLRGEF